MAAFEYLALDPSGRQQKGVLEADSARQVRQLLRERQLAPLDVKPTRTREQSGQGGRLTFARGLSARDLALVTRQLATLVQAALPIEEALRRRRGAVHLAAHPVDASRRARQGPRGP